MKLSHILHSLCFVICGLVIAGCSQQAPQETTEEAATSAESAPAKPMEPPAAEEGYEPAEIILSFDYHNVVTYSVERPCKVGQLGLREAGLTGATEFREADEIMIYPHKGAMEESPKARIWINEAQGGQYWYRTGGKGSAENHQIKKGEAVVVYTRASTEPIIWDNILY